jgi:hypothetical protein
MAYNAPGDNPFGSGTSPIWVKPTIFAAALAFIIVAGAYFAIEMYGRPKTDGAAQPNPTIASSSNEGFLKSFVSAFRGSCVKSANAAVAQKGVDPSADGMSAKVDAYCDCATDRMANEVSVPELVKFKFNPSSEPAASKIKNIVHECAQKIRQ